MSFPSFVIIFGWRLLRREWPKYGLAFLSLLVTSVTFTVVLIGVDGARSYLADRTREFSGGDLVLESGSPIDVGSLVAPLQPHIMAADWEISLLLTVRHADQVTGVAARAVSQSFPLYGTLLVESGTYRFPAPDEVYVERVVLERLGLASGQELMIGNAGYRIQGVIVSEPDALVQGFRLAPRLILSEEGLSRAKVVLAESRSEYEYRFRFDESVTEAVVTAVAKQATESGIEARVAQNGQSGFLRRLVNVERFFLITVLIGAVLAAVNVYANALALVARLRRSFAIFLVEGATRPAIVALVLGLIGSITLIATGLGILLGLGLVGWLYHWIDQSAGVALSFQIEVWSLTLVLLGTFATSLAAAFPAVRDLLALDPRSLLAGPSVEKSMSRSLFRIMLMSLASFVPLFLLAVLLLKRWDWALWVVGGTFTLFVVLSFLFGVGLKALYHIRTRFPFFVRTIIAQKRADGVFGIVAATSIFVALSSIFTLSLLEKSLERFFDAGIGATVPSAYIIDVQTDQVALVQDAVPEAVLFPNIRARIMRIDDRLVQERLQAGVPDEDRELRREFNLTYRTDLLESETVMAGVWQGARTGELLVEQGFAERVGIRLGSVVEFLIQGVTVTLPVTSVRSADTTSGLPFFYFVLHPADVARFPASWFGYAQLETPPLRALERTLAKEAPNISVLDTSVLGDTVREVTGTLLTLLAVITFPPLLLATLLLVTLIATTFSGRQRDALRFRVLGATRSQTLSLYLVETLTTVLMMAVLGAGVAMVIVKALTTWALDAVEPVFFDTDILIITGGLIVALLGYAVALLSLHRRTIREEMTYEENV
jgi:putative ABC transport system permease protein